MTKMKINTIIIMLIVRNNGSDDDDFDNYDDGDGE